MHERRWRHCCDLSESTGVCRGAAEAGFSSYLRRGIALGKSLHGPHDPDPLPPSLKGQSGLYREEPADRANGRCGTGRDLAQIHLVTVIGDDKIGHTPTHGARR
jgi:hypothetical protein